MLGVDLDLCVFDAAVPAACTSPADHARGVARHFGKDTSRDLIGRFHARDLIPTGPRIPRRGAVYTFVTTEQFLVAFGLESLPDLPDREMLEDAGQGGAL